MARNETPMRVLLKNRDTDSTSTPSGEACNKVELADLDRPNRDWNVDDSEVELVHARAHQELRQSLDDEAEAQRRHEQRDRRPVDKRAKHDALDDNGDDHHDRQGSGDGNPEFKTALPQRDEGQRGAKHHRALREIEDARRLVDKHEADRDERIHHASKQAADQGFEEEAHDALVNERCRDRP